MQLPVPVVTENCTSEVEESGDSSYNLDRCRKADANEKLMYCLMQSEWKEFSRGEHKEQHKPPRRHEMKPKHRSCTCIPSHFMFRALPVIRSEFAPWCELMIRD